MFCHLTKYSKLIRSVEFYKSCKVSRVIPNVAVKAPLPMFRTYCSPKPEETQTPVPPPSWKMIKVKYSRSQVVFPVIGNHYTFLRAIEDAVRHWKLSSPDDYELQDPERGFTWPYSENVLAHILGEEREVRLIKKKVIAAKPEPVADVKVTQFIEKVTTEDTTPVEPPLVSESIVELWKDRLQLFFDDPNTMKRMKESHFYFPTESHMTSAFQEFLKTTTEKLRLARQKDKTQFAVFLPLLKPVEELSDEDFHKRVLPVFFSFVNSNLNVPPTEKLDSKTKKQLIQTITNLREPHSWFPYARSIGRKIILHVGPTNSGKTHTALDRLAKAKSGIYCGPLRLLAQEISDKLNNAGVLTKLITGQQRIEPEGAEHTSCTVEMADVNKSYEVGVIDEIQMIGSPDRGWAWTRALLGLPVKELHLCGDPSTLALIQRIGDVANEEVQIRTYQRLSPLIPLERHMSSPWSKLKKGDCVVAFSRKNIYSLKNKIEKAGKKCCVIYGNLPPEARKQQAALFNDPNSDYDVLVASDAIGMGLNLNIKRLVFSTMEKFDGERKRLLNISEIKQIAGRAGRYGSQFPKGEVVCTTSDDNALLHVAIHSDVVPIHTAGLFPNYEQLEIFYRCLKKDVRFTTLLDHFADLTILDDNYFLSNYDAMKALASAIEHLPLSLKDRYTFCLAPVKQEDPTALAYFLSYATYFVDQKEVKTDVVIKSAWKKKPAAFLVDMESVHHVLDMYIWLSFRFEEFVERSHAYAMKNIISDLIETALQDTTIISNKKEKAFFEDVVDYDEFLGIERNGRKRNSQKHNRREKKLAKQRETRRLRRAAKQRIRSAFVI